MMVDINRELLSAYLDDMLDEKDRAKVELLLRVSESARQELAEMARIRQMFAAWSPPAPDPFFVRRVDRLIEEELNQAKGVRQNRRRLHWLATAAMLFLSICSLVFLTQRLDREVEPITLDIYLRNSLDRDVREVANLTEADLSKDRVFDLVFTENIR